MPAAKQQVAGSKKKKKRQVRHAQQRLKHKPTVSQTHRSPAGAGQDLDYHLNITTTCPERIFTGIKLAR